MNNNNNKPSSIFSNNILQNVQLKKTTTNDKSAPKTTGYLTDQEIHEHVGNLLDYNIESWYEALGDFTFPTEFVEMTPDDARLFQRACQAFLDQKAAGKTEPILLDQSIQNDLKEFEKKFEEAFERSRGFQNSVFVKMSSRSAKDSPGQLKALDVAYETRLNEETDLSENNRLRVLFEVATDFLKMKSTKQVIDSFVASERILQDMNVCLSRLDRFHESVVLRKWVPIDVDQEYRGFVSKGRLTALSQYNHVFVSQVVVDNQQDILQLITSTFNNEIKERLSKVGFQDYVIDFALCGGVFSTSKATKSLKDQTVKVWVIELNPFLSSTDGALFSWKHDSDVLLNGREDGQVEFRVRTVYEPSVRAQLEHRWRALLVE